MNYQFFTNSEKTWKAMYEAISLAQKSIYLEMYIFQNDMQDFDFFNLLKEKGKLGLQVKLIIDSLGSTGLKDGAILELQRAGVEVLSLSYLLHRMHRKVLVVDERLAFIGGVNLHQNSRFWNDLMVSIKGPLIKKVVMSFAKSYLAAGGQDRELRSAGTKTKKARVDTWIVEHSPVNKKFHFKRIYKNYFYIYKLAKLGIKFYIEPKMNHAKAIILDESEAMVGSQNLDFLSFDFNSEIGIFFKDRKVVLKLLQIAKNWKKDAILFDCEIYRPKWFDYILSPAINLFSLFYRIFLD